MGRPAVRGPRLRRSRVVVVVQAVAVAVAAVVVVVVIVLSVMVVVVVVVVVVKGAPGRCWAAAWPRRARRAAWRSLRAGRRRSLQGTVGLYVCVCACVRARARNTTLRSPPLDVASSSLLYYPTLYFSELQVYLPTPR